MTCLCRHCIGDLERWTEKNHLFDKELQIIMINMTMTAMEWRQQEDTLTVTSSNKCESDIMVWFVLQSLDYVQLMSTILEETFGIGDTPQLTTSITWPVSLHGSRATESQSVEASCTRKSKMNSWMCTVSREIKPSGVHEITIWGGWVGVRMCVGGVQQRYSMLEPSV